MPLVPTVYAIAPKIPIGAKYITYSVNLNIIFVIEFRDNSKACDYFVKTKFIQDDGFEHTTFVPYVYRRSYLELKTEEEVAEYLISVKKFFTKEWMDSWVAKHKKECLDEIREKKAKNNE